MPMGRIPSEVYESIVRQALRSGPLVSPHLIETMIRLEGSARRGDKASKRTACKGSAPAIAWSLAQSAWFGGSPRSQGMLLAASRA